MALSHLLHMVADLADGAPNEEVTPLLESALRLAAAKLANLPIDAVLAIEPRWVECAEYDPVTFSPDVPHCLGEEKPVVVVGETMYVYGDDGDQAFFWKYEKKA